MAKAHKSKPNNVPSNQKLPSNSLYANNISTNNISTKNIALSIMTSTGDQINIDDCFLEYLDMIAEKIGLEIDYKSFSKMSNSERKGFRREKKIRDILD